MDANFLKWLLEVEIRTKNAFSLLLALLAVVFAYFTQSRRSWFHELSAWGQVASLTVVLVSVFLATFLLWSIAHPFCLARVKRRESERNAAAMRQRIRDDLQSLTTWQRRFLLRFVTEDKTQIPEWEVGRYRAIWDADMDVLVRKGIIIMHRGGMYEIAPEYLTYLQEYWNEDTGNLA
jgi:ABC-type multidrug transport system fused ATPase/permease subunit